MVGGLFPLWDTPCYNLRMTFHLEDSDASKYPELIVIQKKCLSFCIYDSIVALHSRVIFPSYIRRGGRVRNRKAITSGLPSWTQISLTPKAEPNLETISILKIYWVARPRNHSRESLKSELQISWLNILPWQKWR
jgi:hypothetical protein